MNKIESEILLTVYSRGRLSTPVSHKSSKEEVEKVKTSPFERYSEDGTKLLTPKNLYLAKNDYTPRTSSVVMKKTTLPIECVNYFMFGDCPQKLGIRGKDTWNRMSSKARLEWHLNELADGNEFEYKFVID